MGLIAGGTVGSTILLFIFLLVLVLIFYRQRKGSESYSPYAFTYIIKKICKSIVSHAL